MKKLKLLFLVLSFALYSNAQVTHTLYGLEKGGSCASGFLFQINRDGSNFSLAHDFIQVDIRYLYGHLVETPDGMLYGMSEGGPWSGAGAIFQYDRTTNTYTRKYQFDGAIGTQPWGSLMLAQNGKLYGMAPNYGFYNSGVLFEFDPATGVCTKKIDFDEIATGKGPHGSLMQASNGLIYGMTTSGGLNGMGTLFEYDPIANTLVKKVDFDGTNGRAPEGSLIQASNGKIYGMTTHGGDTDLGTLFEYDITTGILRKKADLDGTAKGSEPMGDLVEAANGKLYGLTYSGGTNDAGILFEYQPTDSTFTKKIDFNTGSNTGQHPYNTLVEAIDGFLYGTCTSGGSSSFAGIIFRYNTTTGQISSLSNLSANAYSLKGSMTQASDGKFYGMSDGGGTIGMGTIYRFDPTTLNLNVRINAGEALDGLYPQLNSLMQANDGLLYGLTAQGGTNNKGVVYTLDPYNNNTFTKRADFDPNNGCGATGKLVQTPDSILWGSTSSCGSNGSGTIFKFDPGTNALTTHYTFNGSNDGQYPFGTMVYAFDSMLYGMTQEGGMFDKGVIFQLDPQTGAYQKKVDFDGLNKGSNPISSLVQASDSMLYGITYEGGANNNGVLFRYDPVANVFTKKLDLDDTLHGSYFWGRMTQYDDSTLYGMMQNGGSLNNGTLFSYNFRSNTFTKKYEFTSGTYGWNPDQALLKASDGLLYGKTSYGGTGGYGALFNYDPLTENMTLLYNFTDPPANGFGNIPNGELLEFIDSTNAVGIQPLALQTTTQYKVFPNPGKDLFTVNVDQPAQLTVYNALGMELISKTIHPNERTIDLGGYPSGVYCIKLELKNVKQVLRLVKE